MEKYIAYYRVSTQKQGNSGLGIEAQKSSVSKFINYGNELFAEFQDIESGKNNNRPNLIKAIEECKKQGATLLIAKLDRLSRNASFILTLRDSQVKFKCCDMPDANSVTIGIMAILAQDERERTSQRTKDALAELKRKGVKLGSPQNLNLEARQKGLVARKQNAIENENNLKATALIDGLQKQGKSFYFITKELNRLGFNTRRGKAFTQVQTKILFERTKN
ncbi:recombinase family protein [Flavobacterium aquicola]|uniref:DNA invertase Pin-like site-specific DNA recombinase n=1 Tax=Flavobacterium aquicola TaxID=1682742 RepID=A0A3E0ELL4_9FLAO|nr:recombinase family protein [Flavobacterium aquicola]REG99144.1 DNA invertase Pin-like site-specific DNA recombinase [Flavobacterium aquicola]